MRPDINDPGLLSAPETSLLVDLYELTMAASYHAERMNEPAVFELFVRSLPPRRHWLLAAGLGPALRLVAELRFGEAELDYLDTRGFERSFLDYLSSFRFGGDIEAIPEGTICFANEPLVRVTAPRIEAQLLETLLLNQINFQTMAATKAARVVLAAGAGEPGAGERVIDFSPRRDHGIDAAMKVARSAAIAGCGGTSNVAAAMRYGLEPLGTMAHSYILSFPSEEEAFIAFLRSFPDQGVLLVDTYDVEGGVRNAIHASQQTGVPLRGVRIDSGDLDALSRRARYLLDRAGMEEATIIASGDLEEGRVAELVGAGAPIDRFGVGTELGTSRDSPTVNGIYKIVAHADEEGAWRGVRKLSLAKETIPGAKQVFRRFSRRGEMTGDTVGAFEEELGGEPLLSAAMREGEIVAAEPLDQMRERAEENLRALPPSLRRADAGDEVAPYPVELSPELSALAGGF